MFFTSIGAIAFKSRFSAVHNANQPIGISSYTKVMFGLVRYDNDSEYDNVTNFRWTPNQAGIYSLGCYVEYVGFNEGKSPYIKILKNGSDVVLYDQPIAGAFGNVRLLAYGDIDVEYGDYFEVFTYHNDTAIRNILTMYKCRFWGHRIG